MAAAPLKTLIVPPASGARPTASVIFAHGLGDSGAGWIDVAQMLGRRKGLQHVRWVLPNAPIQPVSLNGGMPMPSWFDITSLDDVSGGEDEQGLLRSSNAIQRLVSQEVDGESQGLDGKGLPSERVVVGGFSQGGAISILAALSSERKLAGAVVLSSWLPLRAKIQAMRTRHSTTLPIFYGHGTADPMVRFAFGERSAAFLEKELGLGAARQDPSTGRPAGVRFERYSGMPHSVCPEEIEHLGEWLEKAIPAQTS